MTTKRISYSFLDMHFELKKTNFAHYGFSQFTDFGVSFYNTLVVPKPCMNNLTFQNEVPTLLFMIQQHQCDEAQWGPLEIVGTWDITPRRCNRPYSSEDKWSHGLLKEVNQPQVFAKRPHSPFCHPFKLTRKDQWL